MILFTFCFALGPDYHKNKQTAEADIDC
ncbi:rCG58703 [Rattus norvegicus]|uniref:RCG58703 n=1 Tax=Rattus norvegicus TaxID=10116 RepID=A6JLE6_RAT|nr:rCG58703 [Rattus norvegicus]